LDKQLVEVEEIIAQERVQLAKKHEEQEALEKGISLPNRQTAPEQPASTITVDRDHSPSLTKSGAHVINNEDVEMNLDIAGDDRNHESIAEAHSLKDKTMVEQDKGSANGSGQVEIEHSLDRDDEDLRDASSQHSDEQQLEHNEHDKEMTTEERNQPSWANDEQRQQSLKEKETVKDNDDADMVE
jgi:hypothetical protein